MPSMLASGSGKCNLTNLLTPEEMAARFTANPRRVLPALRAFPPEELRLWFRRRGVPTSPVDGFHCFPDSQRAGDLLDALLRFADLRELRSRASTGGTSARSAAHIEPRAGAAREGGRP